MELLVVIVLLGLLAAIMVPLLERPLATVVVDAEARRIAAAHTRARMLAISSGRAMLLHIGGDTLSITEVNGADSIRVWQEPGPSAVSATVTGPARPLMFTPLGITYGVSNGTWLVTYRGVERRVVVSRLGRVRALS